MLKAKPVRMYHVADIIKDLKLAEDEDELSVMLSDTAVILMEPIGMMPEGGMILTPKYFTLKTIFKTLNTSLLES